jgi:hypothetical protein
VGRRRPRGPGGPGGRGGSGADLVRSVRGSEPAARDGRGTVTDGPKRRRAQLILKGSTTAALLHTTRSNWSRPRESSQPNPLRQRPSVLGELRDTASSARVGVHLDLRQRSSNHLASAVASETLEVCSAGFQTKRPAWEPVSRRVRSTTKETESPREATHRAQSRTSGAGAPRAAPAGAKSREVEAVGSCLRRKRGKFPRPPSL